MCEFYLSQLFINKHKNYQKIKNWGKFCQKNKKLSVKFVKK